MTENFGLPTPDNVADGTQMPTRERMLPETGDAGCGDNGTEEWYEEGDG